jgi:hypothetical protein
MTGGSPSDATPVARAEASPRSQNAPPMDSPFWAQPRCDSARSLPHCCEAQTLQQPLAPGLPEREIALAQSPCSAVVIP